MSRIYKDGVTQLALKHNPDSACPRPGSLPASCALGGRARVIDEEKVRCCHSGREHRCESRARAARGVMAWLWVWLHLSPHCILWMPGTRTQGTVAVALNCVSSCIYSPPAHTHSFKKKFT